jgi:polar amino acid transport system substrate-binding protein
MMLRNSISAGLFTVIAGVAQAQEDCDRTYVLQQGNTLLSIAQDYYQERSKWSVIYYANEEALGGNLVDLPTGVTLNIPCVDGENAAAVQATATQSEEPAAEPVVEPAVTQTTTQTVQADPTPLQQDNAQIKLLTGSNYAPFTQKDWVGGGMFTELVNASFESAPNPLTFSIKWEDDWSKHLFPMLDGKEFDMGFPWARPNCELDPTNERCANFHFSDPVFEVLELLYTKADSTRVFADDSDIHGATLCRAKGYFSHDLEENGRLWLTNNLVELVRPATPADCFKLLAEGKVDFVAASEFLGPSTIATLGMEGQFKAMERAVSSSGLHVIISKRHWRGTTNLYRFNAGLEALKKTPRYDQIVDRHWQIYYDILK